MRGLLPLITVQSISELTSIDTNLLDQNVDLYYRDLGWGCYRLYLYTKDTILIRKSFDNPFSSENYS